MPKKLKNVKWTPKQVGTITEYSKSRSEHLTALMYTNILAGKMQFAKQSGFFKALSRKTKKSITKCKSKFQKMEQQLYLGALGVPEAHYRCFVWVRKRTRADLVKARARDFPLTTKKWNLRKKKLHSARHARLEAAEPKTNQPERDQATNSHFERVRSGLVERYLTGRLALDGISAGNSFMQADLQSEKQNSTGLSRTSAAAQALRRQTLQNQRASARSQKQNPESRTLRAVK